MGLRTKFNLVLLLAFSIGLAMAAFLSLDIVRRNAEAEVLQNARIMMHSAQAIRQYTADEIRPLLAIHMTRQFLPHSVPSFAAQQNFRALQTEFPDFSYKEAALNPTNLADRASDWEAAIINGFRADAGLEETVLVREGEAGQLLTLARPIRITDEACLGCHSTPEAAPPTMIEYYGRDNGFGWQLGEVVAAQVVSIPMSVPLERAHDAFWVFMAALLSVFIMLAIMLNLLLHVVVVRPVVRISKLAEEVSLGHMDAPEYVRQSRDEIGSLSASFNRMRRSLENAMRMLED
jgi:protein-histidine pros-kinase